jgi:hypothetical protein
MIVVWIEIHDECIGFRVLISSRELPGDAPGFAVVHSGRDVQRIVVIRDPQLRALGRRFPFVGIPLCEARGCRRPDPDLVIEQPIYDDRRRGPRAVKNGNRSVGGFRLSG